LKSKQVQEFKETEIGKIPVDWEIKKINDLYEIRSGLSKPREEFGFGYPFLSFKEIFENFSLPDKLENLVNSSEKERESGSIKRGDVFLTRTSETWEELGMSSVALKDYKNATFNGFAKRLRPINDEVILPEFAAYLFRSPKIQSQFSTYSNLTTRASLNGEAIKQVLLTIPTREEQEKISKSLSDLNAKIKNLQNQNHTLEQTAQAIFQSWFVDFDGVTKFEDSELGKIPKGWSVNKLAEICTTQYGYTESSSDEEIGPKFLRVTDINKQPWINWESVPYCKIEEKNFEKYSLNKGDVVISRMADPGKAGIIEDDIKSVFASYLVRLKVTSIEKSYFIFYFLRSKKYLDYAYGVQSGTTRQNMNAKVITNVDLIVPSDDKLGQFFNLIYPIRTKITKNNHEKIKLTKTRDALLPKLMSGEIRV